MKVLFCTYPLAFQNPGGGEVLLSKTKAGLEKLGVTVDLFDQWTTKTSDYELVHCFHWYTSNLWPFIKKGGSRLVVTPVSWFEMTWRERALRSLKRGLRGALHGQRAYDDDANYSYPDLFLPNSRGEADRFADRFGVPEARLRLIPHGVDPAFAGGDAGLFREKYGPGPFILCVARFEERRKNQLGLIRAIKGKVDATMVFIGSPEAADRGYHERCRREAGDKAVFIDALPHDSPLLAAAYKAAEVVAVPSLLESPGLAALEGGLAGAKLAVTSGGTTREYFSDFVDYLDPGSSESILAAVRRALARPKDGRLAEHIRARYSWERIAGMTLEAYGEVLRRPAQEPMA